MEQRARNWRRERANILLILFQFLGKYFKIFLHHIFQTLTFVPFTQPTPTFTKIIYLVGKCITVGKYFLAKLWDTFVCILYKYGLYKISLWTNRRQRFQCTRYIFILLHRTTLFYKLTLFIIFKNCSIGGPELLRCHFFPMRSRV